jgi:NAD(P)-dependent dehydrogenase (short-subunit alcohol dehydrogenase family)
MTDLEAPVRRNADRLTGRKALVTGAGSGIGRATAIRLAAEGAAVACVDLKGADDTAAAITAAGHRAVAFACDVSDATAVEATVESVVAALDGVDTVCNIAGIGHFAWSHEETPEWFDRIVKVNLNGSFLFARYALPHLLATGNGVILNTASNAGLVGQPWSAAYCASKGGVVMLTKALAYEYRSKGVRVNAVAPGGTNTAIIESFMHVPEGGSFKDLAKVMSPMGQCEPEEIAGLFAFLASDEARYMTGQIVSMDGGIVC